jgi:Methyltransferase domain
VSHAELSLERIEAFAGAVVGLMTGAAVSAGMILGDQLGLYRALAAAGASTSDQLAYATACHPRLTREWLDGQAAAGLLTYDTTADTYALTPEGALVLADEDSPAFLAGGALSFEAIYAALPKLIAAFKGNGGLAWGDHHPSLYTGVARFFRPGYRTNLVEAWIPALDGVADKLVNDGTIADIGCGFGHSCTVMAAAYPNATVHGFDPGSYDLICFFDCLHDMGDPVGIARYARQHLNTGGTVLLVEPFALDDRATNITQNPAAGFFYHASTFLCTPSSLAQNVGRGMGAQSGETGMRAVFEEAGYTHFRRAHTSPFNIVYEARA